MEPAYGMPNDGAHRHEFTLPEKQQAFVTLMTVWAPHLSASEIVFIGWLLANTVSRGKRSGAYSLPQLVNGVPNHRDGGMWTAGTGLSEPTVRRTIASCTAKGLIHTCRDPRGTRFTVVLSWHPATGQAEESNVVTLNLPRAKRRAAAQSVAHVQADAYFDEWDGPGGDQNDQEGVINLITGGCQNDHPSIGKPTNQDTYQGQYPDTTASRPVQTFPEVRIRRRPPVTGAVPATNLPRSGFGKVDASPRSAAPPPSETVASAIERVMADRVTRLQAMRQRKDAYAYEATWAAAWGEAYPGRPCVGWTRKSSGMFKKAVERWPEKALGSVHAFLEWTVNNWDAVKATKLVHLKTPAPSQPNIEFVSRFVASFQEAWADKEELRWRGTLPGTRQAVIALMKREACSKDVALARTIADQCNEAERAKLEVIRAAAARDRHIAEIAAENARRATRFTAQNPHPRAHENAPYVPPRLLPRDDDEPGFGTVPAVVFNMDAL